MSEANFQPILSNAVGRYPGLALVIRGRCLNEGMGDDEGMGDVHAERA